jgi:hypothetical protein
MVERPVQVLEAADGRSVLGGPVRRHVHTVAHTPGWQAVPDRRLPVVGQEVPVFDVIVVGARCAGAPTAMLLARHGYRVLLVDRALPADGPAGHRAGHAGAQPRAGPWPPGPGRQRRDRARAGVPQRAPHRAGLHGPGQARGPVRGHGRRPRRPDRHRLPVTEMQAVQAGLGRYWAALEAVRAMVDRMLRRLPPDQASPAGATWDPTVAATKYFVLEQMSAMLTIAQRLLGGTWYHDDEPFGRWIGTSRASSRPRGPRRPGGRSRHLGRGHGEGRSPAAPPVAPSEAGAIVFMLAWQGCQPASAAP